MVNKELIKEANSYSKIIEINYEPYEYLDIEFEHKLTYDAIDDLLYDTLISLIETIDKLDKHIYSGIETLEAYHTSNCITWLKMMFNQIIFSTEFMDEFEPFYVKNKFA